MQNVAQQDIAHQGEPGQTKKSTLKSKIIAAWTLGLFALAISGYIGQLSEQYWQFNWQNRAMIQAFIMSGMVGFGIWFLRYKIDKNIPISIGLGHWKISLTKFLIGLGLILVPIIITVSSSLIFGWNNITFNLNGELLRSFFIGFGIVFLFEAFPEELLFRGYMYSHLNTKYKRWISSIFTVLLFLLLPVILVPLQKYILGMDVYIAGSNSVTLSYLLIMLFFGSFLQYLRIITKSIWTGIGFHALFVYFDRIMGSTSNNLIQLDTTGNQAPMQIVFATSLLILFGIVIFYPAISKKIIGWNEVEI